MTERTLNARNRNYTLYLEAVTLALIAERDRSDFAEITGPNGETFLPYTVKQQIAKRRETNENPRP